ncbi:NTP transferase domain-containing protein [Altererythrobacter sp. GH1-8]|uniref:nucleotidyltransferase family protein n=1 Tax=Altererythrobacter sp. GH1-8 TaxID=3349333 RepID=UPI00374DB89D
MILAAGRGERFGGDKLNSLCAGKPLGHWALQRASEAGFGTGLVVYSETQTEFLTGFPSWTIRQIVNPSAQMSDSLHCAVRYASEVRAEAILILLADMPLIDPQHLKILAKQEGVAATLYPDGRTGVPAKIPEQHYSQLLSLHGDRGAASWLNHLSHLTRMEAPADSLLDVDTPEALAEAERLLEGA